jgi:large subunit ribosomal protein L18
LRVFRSVSHTYAQVIDDFTGTTLASVATTEPGLKPQLAGPARPGNKAGAQLLGKTIAERLIAKGIKRVVFDRGGFLYHGRIRAVAEAAREAGLEF